MFFFISLYMQQVLGFGPLKTGVSYLPLAGTIIIAAGVASQLVTRLGFKPVLLTGFAFIAAALIWFGQIPWNGTYAADILGPMLLAAIGLGFSFVPVTIGAVSGVAQREAGLASGLINTSQQIGGALGLAVLATVANGRTSDILARSARRHRDQAGAHRGLPVGLPHRRWLRRPRLRARARADPPGGFSGARRAGGRRRGRGPRVAPQALQDRLHCDLRHSGPNGCSPTLRVASRS